MAFQHIYSDIDFDKDFKDNLSQVKCQKLSEQFMREVVAIPELEKVLLMKNSGQDFYLEFKDEFSAFKWKPSSDFVGSYYLIQTTWENEHYFLVEILDKFRILCGPFLKGILLLIEEKAEKIFGKFNFVIN